MFGPLWTHVRVGKPLTRPLCASQMQKSAPFVEVRCDWQIRLIWWLTGCLFAAGAVFAALLAWTLTAVAAEHDVTVSTNNTFADINARMTRCLTILEDQGYARPAPGR